MLIEVKNFSKIFARNYVLKNINLEFVSGRIYGISGKNGSGKTMLMRAISGLITPSQGEIIIDGSKLGKDISFPESIGILIENPGFIPEYNGFKNLKILANIQNKISDSDISKTMSLVGLEPNEKKSFRKYSLGMKQKLGIAAAIMENPEIIILDEPFNALDEDSIEKVRELILQAKGKGKIVLLACHDSDEMESLCDTVIYIKCGEITSVVEKSVV